MPNVSVSAFADDICFYTSAESHAEATDQIQNSLNMFYEWCNEWSISINTDKTYIQYFTRKKVTSPPILTYGATQKYVNFWGYFTTFLNSLGKIILNI